MIFFDAYDMHTVVGSILLSGNHLLRVEKISVGTILHLVDDIGLEIDIDGPRNVFAIAWTMSDSVSTRLTRVIPVSLKKVENPSSFGAACFSGER